jgi:hypothetical protein
MVIVMVIMVKIEIKMMMIINKINGIYGGKNI